MLNRLRLALSRIWSPLLGSTPPIAAMAFGGGRGIIACQINHS